jgi:predicted ester cyclase
MSKPGGTMSVESNKAAVRRCWEEIWNKKNLAHVDEVFSADTVNHFGRPDGPLGPQKVRAMLSAWLSAIPDYQCHIEDIIGEGDLVAMHLRFTGTHSAAPLTISGRTASARNRTFNEPEIIMFRFHKGKIIDLLGTWDRLSFLEHLGAIEPPG